MTPLTTFGIFEREPTLFWMTVLGVICWPICFVWMHRISSRQDALLREIREQAKRIEDVSRTEHDLIREIHPQVDQIKEELDQVADTVKAPGR